MSYKLTWANDPTSTASRIYRSTTPMDAANLPAPLAVVDAGVTEYVDDAVADWTRYFYRVGAYREALGQEAALSGEVAFGYDGGSTLDLQFAANDYQVIPVPGAGKVSRAFADIITFTRSTAAWEWDWQGNYSEVAAGVMRIAHDPLTKSGSTTPQTLGTGSYTFDVAYQYAIGAAVRVSADANNWMVGRVTASTPDSVTIWVAAAPVGAGTYSSWTLIVRLGIRVEEQRTNLLLNSVLAGGTAGIVGAGAVAPTGWSFSGPTPNGEITYAATPFGTLGVRFQATAQRPAFGRSVTALANTLYSYHARITALVGSVEIQNAVWAVGFPVDAVRTFWRNGVTVAGNTIVAAGDHVAVIVTMGATAGTFGARFGAGAQTNATCDVTMTMPQVEAGFPSSHIPTGASQVIRAGEVPVVNTLAPWFNAPEGALVVVVIPAPGLAGYRNVVTMGSSSENQLYMSMGAAGVTAGGVSSATPSISGVPPQIKAAMTYKAGSPVTYARNGELRVAPTSIPGPPAFGVLAIGRASTYSGDFFNGIISEILYYPRVIAAQQASA